MTTQQQTPKLNTVGNALTVSRLILLPIVVAGIVTHNGWLAVGAMALAVVTDLLDGRISRRLGQASQFGRNLDSTVDFVLIYGLFIAFYAAGRLPTYQFAVVYLAMLMTLAVQLAENAVASKGVKKMRFAKPTGALQYVFLLWMVAREILPHRSYIDTIHLTLFILLALSIAVYMIDCLVNLRKMA